MKNISISDIKGFKIGNAQDKEKGTGCTVIICEKGAVAGVDVRGGGPATRETDLLNPKNMVQQIHAVMLSGGSAFGLEAGSGAMDYLSERGIGFDLKGIFIPIVCGASLFDCSVADMKAYPHKEMGYKACEEAEKNDPKQGNFGAGTGASVGKYTGFDKAMKTGLGMAAVECGNVQVGAIVAVNACGDVFYPNSDKPIAGIYDQKEKKRYFTEDAFLEMAGNADPNTNTTIGCIITNAKIDKAAANKLASIAHNGYAHCIRPVHTYSDGDTIFAMSSNEVEVDLNALGVMAVKAMEQAIVNACTLNEGAYGIPSFKDIQ